MSRNKIRISKSRIRSIIREEIARSLLENKDTAAATVIKDISNPTDLPDEQWENIVSYSESLSTQLPGLSLVANMAISAPHLLAMIATGETEAAGDYAVKFATQAGIGAVTKPYVSKVFSSLKGLWGASPEMAVAGGVMLVLATGVPIAAFVEFSDIDDPYKKIRYVHDIQKKPVSFGVGVVVPTPLTSQNAPGAMQNPVWGMFLDTLVNGVSKISKLREEGVLGQDVFDWVMERRRGALDLPGVLRKISTAIEAARAGIEEEDIKKVMGLINGFFAKIDKFTPAGELSLGSFDRMLILIDRLANDVDKAGVSRSLVRKTINNKVNKAGWGGSDNPNKGLGGYFKHRASIALDGTSQDRYTILSKKYRNTLR